MVDQKGAEGDEQYITHHPVAIVQILKELAKNKTTLNLSFNYGQEQGLTTVIGVSADKKSVYMDKSLDTGFNKKLLASDSIIFTKTDGIKIRWSCKKLTAVKLKDGEAFKLALPKGLYRFQRREFFRSLTPATNPIICNIPYRNPSNDQDEKLEMPLVNASLGGIGTVAGDHLSSILEVEKIFPHCAIAIPRFGELDTSLCVKNISETVMANGAKKFRVGFQFVGLSRAEERIVQQYVLHLEREALVLVGGS